MLIHNNVFPKKTSKYNSMNNYNNNIIINPYRARDDNNIFNNKFARRLTVEVYYELHWEYL